MIGIWLGRPDGTAMPGVLGADLAAPILFDAFQRLKAAPTPLPPPPPATLTVATADLPPPLRYFRPRGLALADEASRPRIAFPPDGARLALESDGEGRGPLMIKLMNGVPPFTWMVDGRPLGADPRRREALWRPDGAGFVAISVIDARGSAARAQVFVE